MFVPQIGLDSSRLRFRQHLKTEMAHYAADCWDLEINTSYGWIECVGHADRACYDLAVHAKATNTSMVAAQRLDKPTTIEVVTVEADKKKIGLTFKGQQKIVLAALEDLAADPDAAASFEKELMKNGQAEIEGHSISADMVRFSRCMKEVQEVKFLPSVIEPSFGMGRILYALLENSFHQPDPINEPERVVMRFNAMVAPTKCHIYPLQSNVKFGPIVSEIAEVLTTAGLTNKASLNWIASLMTRKSLKFFNTWISRLMPLVSRSERDMPVLTKLGLHMV